MQSIVDGLAAHICVIDAYGDIVVVNLAWKEFASANGGDENKCMEGNYFDVLSCATSEAERVEFEGVLSGIKKVIDCNVPTFTHEYHCHSPGKQRWFILMANAFDLYGEKFAVLSHTNITERKLGEIKISSQNEELQQRVAELAEAIKEQTAFSYAVSHDLRAPLRHINSYSTILVEDYGGDIPEEARNYLDRIRASSEKLGGMITSLLDLSCAAKADLAKGPVNLSAIATQALAVHQEAEPTRCVDQVIAKDVVAWGNFGLLKQLMINLIGNAWKYTSKKPMARIEFGVTGKAGEETYFVSDDGSGFDMAFEKKIFSIFERQHGSEFEGNGIGLDTALRIITRHNGKLWAKGAPGKGATFYFTLEPRRHNAD